MNEGTNSERLDDAWDAGWWGAAAADTAATAGAAAPAADQGSLPHHARGSGFMSWLFSWGSSSSSGSSSNNGGSKPERRTNRRQGRPPAHRRAPSDGIPARLPRPPSTPKLPSGAGSSTAYPQRAQQQQQQQQAAGIKAPPGSTAAAQQPAQPTQQQQQAADTRRRAARQAAKQANYAERRQAWRQRIDAIKAKRGLDGNTAHGAGAAGASGGPRIYSKHVAIPVPAGSAARGSSSHGTPHGSPHPREPLLHAAEQPMPELEAPLVWLGCQVCSWG